MVQAVLALHCAHFAPLMCGTAPLAAPTAQRLTHRVTQLLAPLSVFSLHPAGPQLPPGDPEAECCAMLRFLQLTLGLLVPVAWQAAVEPALFALHQQVRAGVLWSGRRGLGALQVAAFGRCMLWRATHSNECSLCLCIPLASSLQASTTATLTHPGRLPLLPLPCSNGSRRACRLSRAPVRRCMGLWAPCGTRLCGQECGGLVSSHWGCAGPWLW